MASYFAFCFLLWHCGHLLQWLPTLPSVFLLDTVVIFFNGYPLCFLFPVVTLWLSSSVAAHFAFCFLLWHCGYLLWWLPTLLSVFLLWHCGYLFSGCPLCFLFSCCDNMVIFFNGCPLCFLFSCCDIVVIFFNGCLLCFLFYFYLYCFNCLEIHQEIRVRFHMNKVCLTHFSLETPKRVIGTQCRSRSDATEWGIWSDLHCLQTVQPSSLIIC